MSEIHRFAVWQITETAGFDSAAITIRDLQVTARGTAVWQLPKPCWIRYELTTDPRGEHRRLTAQITTDDGRHSTLDLQREAGQWRVDGTLRPDLAAAADCDLAGCPLTNLMPVRRSGLHHAPGRQDFVMAFVQVPSLRVVAVPQTYEHLRPTENGALVRYSSGTFASDLLLDPDGIVLEYPSLGTRVPARSPIGPAQRADGPGSLRPSG